ncbi:uncharacterized protein LOC119398054 [Rhipicephalus sanguineus]|uniref:uncharacterized protein LOC119398054 n=1 Tax=Rhipicephalus sanguineus TaxID=34632 RepID=UPI0018950C49|nr:uncharacterized protein LOC119398054 [Rhipicephalus sanguineus]
MLADTQWKVLLLVLFTALGSEVFCCRPFDAVRGKRLLRLKGNFIKIQNQCKKQIFTAIKLVARDNIKTLMGAFCDAHNACMESTAEGNAVELIDCWSYAVKNETGPFRALGSPDNLYQAIGATFACLRNTELTKLSLQSIDDLTSFGMEYALAIG